jgi:hypothetical protein
MMLKIDIVHAFDSVAWSFLLEVLHHMGFSHGWINWMLAILSSTTTRVVLNGAPGDKIFHARGLW